MDLQAAALHGYERLILGQVVLPLPTLPAWHTATPVALPLATTHPSVTESSCSGPPPAPLKPSPFTLACLLFLAPTNPALPHTSFPCTLPQCRPQPPYQPLASLSSDTLLLLLGAICITFEVTHHVTPGPLLMLCASVSPSTNGDNKTAHHMAAPMT